MDSAQPTFQVVLSHAELAYLLTLFDAVPHLGVDRDPLDGLDEAQLAVVQATARHALRARDLLRYDATGQPLLDDNLLHSLHAYAAPQQLIIAYRYVAGDDLPLAWFAYRRNGAAVIHTRPDDLIHAFTQAADVSSLAAALVDFCAGDAAPPARRDSPPIIVPAAVLAAARTHADAGDATQCRAVLQAGGLAPEVATALATALLAPTALTIVTCATANDGAAPRRQDAIYWQSDGAAQLIIFTEDGAVRICNGDEDVLQDLLNEMV